MLPLPDRKLIIKQQSLKWYNNSTEKEKMRPMSPEINACLHRNLGYDILASQIIEKQEIIY